MDEKSRKFDLRQLECFCAVARLGSFTKAAEEVGVAQSSLSEQIAKLEQGLVSVLFERLARRIELTPAGEALLPGAQAMLHFATSWRISRQSTCTCARHRPLNSSGKLRTE
jgi:LysR family transcriptional regulator, hydrogen peroxide-inducible genes activator